MKTATKNARIRLLSQDILTLVIKTVLEINTSGVIIEK